MKVEGSTERAVRIVEVGRRDGLQNQPTGVDVEGLRLARAVLDEATDT